MTSGLQLIRAGKIIRGRTVGHPPIRLTPAGRSYHTAVWTGSEMIIWGGVDDSGFAVNTGGKYNPGTNSWTATTTINAPSGREFHTAVWSGSEMIVWGGYSY